MVDKIKEELEELEAQENEEAEESDDNEETVEEETEDSVEESDEAQEEEEEEKPEVTDEEKEKKRAEYRKRVEERKAQREAAKQPEREEQGSEDDYKDAIFKQAAQLVQEQQYMKRVGQAEKELTGLEKEFSEVYDDYEDKLKQATEFTKRSLMKRGLSESEALEQIRLEKIMIADKAAAAGQDPVEAVYNECNNIVSVIDEYAAELGYTRQEGRKKTNLEKMRKLSKPNAMTGGAGKSAKAAKPTFDELDDDDLETIHNTPIWQVAQGD